MIHKLFRKYNQNRQTIWVTIIFIAFFVILLHTVFGLIRSSRNIEQAELLNAYYQNQNSNNITTNNNSAENKVGDGNNIQTSEPITTIATAEEVINSFVNLCNENKIEEAYNMISEDCKTVLFPTITDFQNNYYSKVFTGQKNIKIERSIYGGDVYKITYMNNLLANGGYQPENTLEDYIYIDDEEDDIKISLNKFLYNVEINNTQESNDISIKILKKKVYLDYEEYQIQVLNNATDTIYIIPDNENVYLLDENDISYTSSIDELQSGATIIEPNDSTIFELTFFKVGGSEKMSKVIIFNEIITNYTDYQNGNEANTVRINVNV